MKDNWIRVFDDLTTSNLPYLHQASGWKDIGSEAQWDEYVSDVIRDPLPPGASVFEAGCGCLAFLLSVRRRYPGIHCAGVDASSRCIEKIRTELLPGGEAEAFRTGVLPGGLREYPDAGYDVVVSNSVFQYLPTKQEAQDSVLQMLRLARPGGLVIVADVCDAARSEQNEDRMKRLWATYARPDGLPSHAYYAKRWWSRFESPCVDVTIRHSRVEHYWRRHDRYNVYLRKKDGLVHVG